MKKDEIIKSLENLKDDINELWKSDGIGLGGTYNKINCIISELNNTIKKIEMDNLIKSLNDIKYNLDDMYLRDDINTTEIFINISSLIIRIERSKIPIIL